jgi:hypothetical protein
MSASSAAEAGGAAHERRREVGDLDQVWSLSTAKPGNGVEQLRDGNLETYWQCVRQGSLLLLRRTPSPSLR